MVFRQAIFLATFLFIVLPSGMPAAQTLEDIDRAREQTRMAFKALLQDAIPMGEAEAERFFAVYDDFISDFSSANDPLFEAVIEFGEQGQNPTDEVSGRFVDTLLSVESDQIELQRAYFARFATASSPDKALKAFFLLRKMKAELEVAIFANFPR